MALAELFTKDAMVEGAGRYIDQKSGFSKEGLGLEAGHFYLKDGQLHTIHICGDSTKNKRTGIYIPKEFSFTEYVGGRMGTATFTNTANKQLIRASHILVIREIQLDDKNQERTIITAKEKSLLESQIKENMKITNTKAQNISEKQVVPAVRQKAVFTRI